MREGVYLVIAVFLSYSGLLSAQASSLTLGLFPYVTTSKLIIHNNAITKHINKISPHHLSLVTAKNLSSYITNLENYKYDLIFSAPHLARHAEKEHKYKRVAMTTHSIRGVYITKHNSSINEIGQLKGKIISLTPKVTILHQIALNQLNKMGITPVDNFTIKPIKTFSNAIHDVLKGNSDAAVTGIKIWNNLPAKSKKKLKAIALTPPTSGFMIMAKPGLNNKIIHDLQKHLLSFNRSKTSEKYIFKGFKLITNKDMYSLDFHSKIFE